MGLLDTDVSALLGRTPFTWPLMGSALIVPLAAASILYRLFLHPLRAVPGPKLWAASSIPYLLAWVSGRAPFIIHDLHRTYGDVVRIGPNRLSFTHPDAWQEIRGHRKSGENEHAKDPALYAMSKNNILGASRADHARVRRILSHGFSAKSMQGQQPLIMRYVDLLMQRLEEMTRDESGQPREAVANLASWFNFTTFDIIGDLAFGEPFGCLEESRYHPWVDAIFQGVKQFGLLIAFQWHLPGLLDVMKTILPRRYLGKHADAQIQYARERLERRLAVRTSRPDFAEAMAKAESDDGKTLTIEEMASNGRLLVVAGSETTATALSGAVYFLASHPGVQKRLAKEVRSSFTSAEEMNFLSVSKLGYLLAVLDEAMRMFPPVPNQLTRVCQSEGDMICGYHVPGGTRLDIWPSAMNYSSKNFTEPNRFIPERWLAQDKYQGQLFDKRRHNALQSFSVGPRNCIGKNLAYVEMRLILARLVWGYDLALADDASRRFLECKAFSLWMKGPLNVCLTPVARAY